VCLFKHTQGLSLSTTDTVNSATVLCVYACHVFGRVSVYFVCVCLFKHTQGLSLTTTDTEGSA
jgi:hypothetical protein